MKVFYIACHLFVENALKQEGESCRFSRLEDCGDCDQGLECDTLVEDACGVCIIAPGELYEIYSGPALQYNFYRLF